jgi:hypothetical protein
MHIVNDATVAAIAATPYHAHHIHSWIRDGYIECLFWTEQDELRGCDELSDEAEAKVSAHISNFMEQLAAQTWTGVTADKGVTYVFEDETLIMCLCRMLGSSWERVGHDLWLTRNGHGAGFWDRGWREFGNVLSEIARGMGSVDAYRGDDHLVYFL